MAENNQIQVNVEANMYAISGVRVVPTEEEFIVQLISGNLMRQYSMTPKHAKRLSLLLNNTIKSYEQNFGELKTELPAAPNQTEKKKIGFNLEDDNKKGN